jgi:RNA polymerase sigma-70 factor, ECF subfamily
MRRLPLGSGGTGVSPSVMGTIAPVGDDADFTATLGAAQVGEKWALGELYRELHPAVLRFLRARAGTDGDDLASETWLDVARGLRSFSGDRSGFRAWVFTIARRRAIDHRRRIGRRPASTPLSALDSAPAGSDTEQEAIDEGALGDEAARRLVAALPPEQADIVLLRVVGGFSVEEVASITGRRPGTVRVVQHRALRRLAREIDRS